MKDWVKDYFTFTRKEQRGLAILLVLMLLSMLFSIFSPLLIHKKEYDISAFKDQVEAFLADTISTPGDSESHQYPKHESKKQVEAIAKPEFDKHPFNFDPNKLTEKEWEMTGLEGWMIRNILKFKEKGGSFKRKEDLRKIYGMTDSLFAVLEPYIRIEDQGSDKEKYKNKGDHRYKDYDDTAGYKRNQTVQLEINSADSADLLDLPGIGPYFASRIIRYRNQLGGFFRTDQLLEVREMDSVRYAGIKDKLTLDIALVRKMDLNSIAFKEMMKHPYFEYYLVKAIFSYRDKIKSYDSVGQLKSVQGIYPEVYLKISPYLEVKPKVEGVEGR